MNEIPPKLEEELNGLSVGQLKEVIRVTNELIEEKSRQDREVKTNVQEGRQSDRPETVPAKATLTKKTINNNEYWYWQWREGDSIKSKYKEPVSSE